jgi:hypothetical protein
LAQIPAGRCMEASGSANRPGTMPQGGTEFARNALIR